MLLVAADGIGWRRGLGSGAEEGCRGQGGDGDGEMIWFWL